MEENQLDNWMKFEYKSLVPRYDMYDVVKVLKRYKKLLKETFYKDIKDDKKVSKWGKEYKLVQDMIKEITPGKHILD